MVSGFFDAALMARARALVAACTKRGLTLATAESCTGGLIAALLTEVPGSSIVIACGFVTYSNSAKSAMLGVPAALIAANGAVSAPVARAMADGALAQARTDLAISVTGIAGPGGASAAKPVGLVHFAFARQGHQTVHVERRFGDLGRSEVRRLSVEQALDMIEAGMA